MYVPDPTRLPSGNWHIKMVLGGKSVSVTRTTAKECRREAELIKAEYRNKKMAVCTDKTMRTAMDEYLDDKGVLSPATIRGYRSIQKNRFQKYADTPMSKVNWQKAVSEESRIVSAKTVANAWGIVASLMKYCGLPVPSVRLPQIIKNEHEWLTPEQIPVFLDRIKGNRAELPALLALHGLRRSEIYALTADSFKGGTIHVRGSMVFDEQENRVIKKENKNSSSRRDVPIMIPRLKELLDSKPNFYDVPITNLTKSINATCRKAGLPEVGTHGLRHSFASLCYHNGLSERQTMLLGGWSDPATMRKIYTHISQADMDVAADKLKAFFEK